jgi:NTE family protein
LIGLSSSRSIGLVLSGGGARGAYEVGVLLHIAEELPHLLDRVRVISGSSVGAVNSAYLASHGLTPDSVRQLAKVWRGLVIDELVAIDRAGLRELLAAGGKRLIGKSVTSPPVGLLRVDGIAKVVREQADWHNLARVVRRGRFDAVGFAATDIATGATHFFVDHAPNITPRWSRGEDAPTPIRTVLGPAHVLASAAIPILFPPVEVARRWYMDGGVRYNTPLAPALGLGAQSLLLVSVRALKDTHQHAPEGTFSGFGQIVGKVLDSVFLDRVGFDLDRLTRINHMVEAIEESCGSAAMARVHARLAARDRPPYRAIDTAHIRPTYDLGALAAAHLDSAHGGRPLSFARVLSALFQDDTGTTGDAASFLLFDGKYADTLIDVGRKDAEASHAELARL